MMKNHSSHFEESFHLRFSVAAAELRTLCISCAHLKQVSSFGTDFQCKIVRKGSTLSYNGALLLSIVHFEFLSVKNTFRLCLYSKESNDKFQIVHETKITVIQKSDANMNFCYLYSGLIVDIDATPQLFQM